VYETALAYTEADRLADNASLFKLLAKSVGHRYGIMPTFMAKPYTKVSRIPYGGPRMRLTGRSRAALGQYTR